MKSSIVSLILAPVFFFSFMPEVRADNFEVPAASVNSEELRGIRDRLAVSLFFRGELADKIIEAGLQDRLMKFTGQKTHSAVRLALLEWINKNHDEASRLYFYLRERRPSDAPPPEAIEYKLPSWQINPDFLGLVQGVNRVAGDAAAGDEELSLTAQRLFDSSQAPPEDSAPRLPEAVGGARGAGRSAAGISYADYNLNTAGAERESRALGGRLESVKSSLGAGPAGGEKGEIHVSQRRIFDETFFLYRDFVVALAGLKGRAKITREEAGRLEALRRSVRKNLGELEALSVMREINRRAGAIPAGAPGAKALLADARLIEEAVKNFIAGLEKDPEKVKAAGPRLAELGKAFEFWTLKFSAHDRLVRLKGRIAGRGFSCVFDKLVFEYLVRFHPSADYVRLSASLAAKAGTIDVSLGGVAVGDYESAALFSGGGGGTLVEKIEEAEAEADRLESYSRFNRLLQFVFWDAFVNPLCLEPAPRGIAADNSFLFPDILRLN